MSQAQTATPILKEASEDFDRAIHVDVIDEQRGFVERSAQLPPGRYSCYRNYDAVDQGQISRFIIDPENTHLVLRIREGE